MSRFAENKFRPRWMTAVAAVSFLAVAVTGAAASHEAALAPAGGSITELVLQVAPGSRVGLDDTNRSIAAIRRRLDLFGVKNAQVIRQGRDRIAVEALGDSIPQRLPALLTRVGRLTFQLVDDSVSGPDLDAGRLPPGDVLARSADPACADNCSFALKPQAWVSGDMVERAIQGFNAQTDEPTVEFRLDERGARLFAEATRDNVGKRLAIVLDGRVIDALVIEDPIMGGEGEISSNFTVQSANDLALLLCSGALPAPLVVVAERSTPSR